MRGAFIFTSLRLYECSFKTTACPDLKCCISMESLTKPSRLNVSIPLFPSGHDKAKYPSASVRVKANGFLSVLSNKTTDTNSSGACCSSTTHPVND